MWWRRLRWLLTLIGLTALATMPIGWRACANDQRLSEARQLLAYLADQAKRGAVDGQLPRAPVGPTPPIGTCCRQGGQCAVDQTQWRTPGWMALHFTIDDPHRFSYEYQPSPDGGAVFRAVGDVACDGRLSILELHYVRDPSDPSRFVTTWASPAELTPTPRND